MYLRFGLVSVLIVFVFDCYLCLQNVTLLVSPPAVQRGKHVSLLCQYDLEGAPLYSVKWYRGRYEFYRYSPSEIPSTKIFPYPGINVDVSRSNASQVVLSEVGFSLSGNLSCEVTTDAPSFSTAAAVKHMMVVDLPKNGPTILVEKERYDPGDKLKANCSAFPSKPATMLSFSINNLPAANQETKVLPGPDSLLWSFLPIDITLLPSHFDDVHSVLLLRCSATISGLYHNYTELRIPYRKEPIPERVTSQSMASSFKGNGPAISFQLSIIAAIFVVNSIVRTCEF